MMAEERPESETNKNYKNTQEGKNNQQKSGNQESIEAENSSKKGRRFIDEDTDIIVIQKIQNTDNK